MFDQTASGNPVSLMSPDNTSDGWLKKKWKIIDDKRCLIKGEVVPHSRNRIMKFSQSRIMDRLDIPHVKYSLLVEDDYPYSVCEDFITPETELISAWHLMQTSRKPNHISIYQHYINCCEENGVPEIRKALDQMIVLDYLLVNEDRHLNNFRGSP